MEARSIECDRSASVPVAPRCFIRSCHFTLTEASTCCRDLHDNLPRIVGAVFIGILGAVDAAYSGDWSRIGALTKADELFLQHAVQTLGEFHLACATLGVAVVVKRGGNWSAAAAKVSYATTSMTTTDMS